MAENCFVNGLGDRDVKVFKHIFKAEQAEGLVGKDATEFLNNIDTCRSVSDEIAEDWIAKYGNKMAEMHKEILLFKQNLEPALAADQAFLSLNKKCHPGFQVDKACNDKSCTPALSLAGPD